MDYNFKISGEMNIMSMMLSLDDMGFSRIT